MRAWGLGRSLCFSPVGGLPGARPVVQPMQGLAPAWTDGAHRAQGYARGAEGNRGPTLLIGLVVRVLRR
jgi:hypothetical protein